MTSKTNLTINPQRLWDALMKTAKFGATPKGGIKRLTVTDEDKKAAANPPAHTRRSVRRSIQPPAILGIRITSASGLIG